MDLWRDAVLGARSLRRTPAFSFVAIATLALAIAVTATSTAIVNAYLIRPLPYAASDRIYHVQYAPPGPWEPAGLSGLDWTSLADVVEHPIGASSETLHVIGSSVQAPSRALYVSQGFIDGLGVRAALGRTLGSADYRAADPPAVLISARLFRDRFGADSSAIGQEFQAEIESRDRAVGRFRVAGVLPEGFWFGRDSRDLVDVILPLAARVRVYRVRLREHVTPAMAIARLNEAVRRVATDLPPGWPGVTLESARDRYVSSLRPVLSAVTVATALVLGIATANLALLTLVRALRRRKEIGVRLALGAGRGRILRMLVVEAGLVSIVATAAGLAVAVGALRLFGAGIAEQLGRPAPGGEGALAVDATVVLLVAAIGAALAALLPLLALAAPWTDRLALALQTDSRSSTDSASTRRARSVLIVAQIAGSLALLVGSGLMIQSLTHMVRADYGIRTDHLVRVGVDFPNRPDTSPAALVALYDRLVERMTALTGAPVPLLMWPQFAETSKQPVETDPAGSGPASIGVVPVSAPYFERLGIRVVQGRAFTDADRLGSEPVAVVSESAARRLWPGGSPVGRRVRLAIGFINGAVAKSWHTVVGVVSDVRQTYDDTDAADIYYSFLQAPPPRYAWLYVTTDTSRIPEREIRSAVAEIDPRAGVRVAVPLREEAARQWAAPRFLAGLISGLAVVSIVFAAIGIYGVTAFSLQQRQREIAIRWALGATARAITRMFVAEWSVVLAAGLGLGVIAAFGVGRALRSQLHLVSPLDPWTVLGAAALLAAIAFAAIWRPASRAALRSHRLL